MNKNTEDRKQSSKGKSEAEPGRGSASPTQGDAAEQRTAKVTNPVEEAKERNRLQGKEEIWRQGDDADGTEKEKPALGPDV